MNTVGALKDGVSGLLQGLDLNNVTDLIKLLKERRELLSKKRTYRSVRQASHNAL